MNFFYAENRHISNLLTLFLIATCFLYLFSLSYNWKPEWDSAYYLIISKSILNGNGFTYLGYPCLKIPFGFPLLISPIVFFTNTNFFALNMLMLSFAGLAFLMVYKFFRTFFSHTYALLITFFTSFSSLVLYHTGFIMIDIPYLAISFLALFLAVSYLKKNSNVLLGIFAVISLLSAFFLRTVGFALIAGIFMYLLLYRREIIKKWNFALLVLLTVIPIASWLYYSNSKAIDNSNPVWQLSEFLPSKDEYKRYRFDDPLSTINSPFTFVDRGVQNLVYYSAISMTAVSGLYINPSKENIKRYPLLLLGLIGFGFLILLSGFFYSIVRDKMPFDFYFLLYIGILCIWSAREPRYLIPVFPFLFHYFLTGIFFFVSTSLRNYNYLQKFSHIFSLIIIVLISTLFLIANMQRNFQIVKSQHQRPYYQPNMIDYFKIVDWVKANTTPDCRVVSVNAPIMAFFSERHCISFPRVKSNEALLSYLLNINCDFLIVSPSSVVEKPYLQPVLTKYPEYFIKQFSINQTVIYKIKNRS